MKKLFLLLFLSLTLLSCSKVKEGVQTIALRESDRPEDLTRAFSYVLGYYLARAYESDVDYNYMAMGVLDYAGGERLFSEKEMEAIATRYYLGENERYDELRMDESEKNVEEAEIFLSYNAARKSVFTLPSGVQIEYIKQSSGESAENARYVSLDYRLILPNGQVVDSSYERAGSTVFDLDSLFTGFSEAVRVMKVGETIRAWIPPELGYGMNGPEFIPPMSYLIFDITLNAIIKNTTVV